MNTHAQTNIYGKVTASDGKPIADVHIFIDSLNLATTTDLYGKFSFHSINDGIYNLHFKHIAFDITSEKILISGQPNYYVNIMLNEKPLILFPTNITASRYVKPVNDIPVAISIMEKDLISSYPITNFDNILQSVSNVYVNRSWGIFSRNASVIMRGLSSSDQTLVLVDGVPINHSSGGTINWHFIQAEDIEKVEVIKGPSSALYGMNAMGGVINILTNKPKVKFGGNVGLDFGSYETYGSHLNLNGDLTKENKGFYYDFNSFYRQGNGYINEPISSREWYNTEIYLSEFGSKFKGGYQFNKDDIVELQHHFYSDKRGQGKAVVEKDGSFDAYTTNMTIVNIKKKIGQVRIDARVFNQNEVFFRQSESINSTGTYKLYHQNDHKNDAGLWVSATRKISKTHELIMGSDVKFSNVNSETIYRTSTDILSYGGKLNYYGLFFQDEILLSNRINLVAGFRFDHAFYQHGFLNILEPTSNTGFVNDYANDFEDKNWMNFSPKLALNYKFEKGNSLYISYSTGFLAPKVDDLSKSGKITKGFKLANPELEPEKLKNFEIGTKLNIGEKLNLNSAVYYSRGKDFQYFIGTGDSVDTGGDNLKPVLRRENISDIAIAGAEIEISYNLTKNFGIKSSYSYNYSEILRYRASSPEINIDITGNHLVEVPDHLFYVGIYWKNKFLNTSITYNYIGNQWYDDNNSATIDPYSLVDVNLSKTFKTFQATLIIQDLFDVQYIDRKERLSPGRYFLFKLNYKF